MPARTMGKGINRTLGKWKKRRKIKYLVLCNCALLAVFLVLLGTAFLSGKFSQQTQGQKEEAVSQSAQHIPQPLDFGEAGPAAPDPGITQPEQEDPGSLNSEDAIQGQGSRNMQAQIALIQKMRSREQRSRKKTVHTARRAQVHSKLRQIRGIVKCFCRKRFRTKLIL